MPLIPSAEDCNKRARSPVLCPTKQQSSRGSSSNSGSSSAAAVSNWHSTRTHRPRQRQPRHICHTADAGGSSRSAGVGGGQVSLPV